MNSENSSRSQKLDFLRGLAVVLVLGRHLSAVPDSNDPFLGLAKIWKRGGWVGVDLFFVLSGFLISSLLFKEWAKHRSFDPARFLIRRGLKIYPGFYVMLAVSVLWIFPGIEWRSILCEALFVQNYFLTSYAFWPHTWTLAIEEHFYFSLAFIFWLLSRTKSPDPFRLIPWLCLGLGIACLASRVINYQTTANPAVFFFQSHFRIDSLSFGVLLSYWYHRDPQKLSSWTKKLRPVLLMAVSLAFLVPFLFDLQLYFFHYMYGLTLIYLGFGAALLLVLDSAETWERVPLLIRRSLAFIGFYSYSIYLWHAPMNRIYSILFPRYLGIELNFWQAAAVYLIGAVCQGVLMAVLIELPFLKLRERLFPSRS